MEIIIHRVNLLKKLKKLPTLFGAEIDIRSKGSKLILNHEASNKGDKFEDYLSEYKHGTLILNIKEAGIENEVIKKVEILAEKEIMEKGEIVMTKVVGGIIATKNGLY